jgi:molecular chaperone GrpE
MVRVVDRRHHAEAEADAAPDRSPYPTIVEELRARTEAAEKRAREVVARSEAEVDAVRERLARDVERRVAEGRSGLLGGLLEVVDDLERALEAGPGEAAAIGRGVELTRQKLLGLLRAQGVEPLDLLGQPYDPHLAEAVAVEPAGPEQDGLVVGELQRGYRLGDRILRPARVRVGRARS